MRHAFLAAVVMVSAMGLWWTVGPAHSDPLPTVTVQMAGVGWAPPVLAITTGTTIVWHAAQSPLSFHTVSTGSITGLAASPNDPENNDGNPDTFHVRLDAPQLVPTTSGNAFSHTFDNAGTFTIFCVPHYGFGMRMVVAVG